MFSSDEQPLEIPEEERAEEMPQAETAPEDVSASQGEPQEESMPVEEEETQTPQAESEPEETPAAMEEPEVVVEFKAEEPAAEEEPVVETKAEEPAAEEDSTPITIPQISDEEEEDEDEDGRAWYVIHCYSGYENKVRYNLEQRIESMNMKDYIFDVVVPTEEEIEVKEGKRRSVERRVFPGYILVNMVMTEESWYVVRNTPGVTSFVGMGNEPIPLRKDEVSSIVKRMEADAPRIKVTFRQGERVRIIDGPFNDFRGTVDEIDMERAKVRVMVNFFGRETPVELDFLQVEKA